MKSMRSMCWMSGIVVALAFSAGPAFAKHHSGPIDRLEANVSQLHLSAKQQKKVNVIMTDLRAKVQKLEQHTANTADTKTTRHEIGHAIHEATKQISALLTTKQRIKFEDLTHEARAKHKAATQPAT